MAKIPQNPTEVLSYVAGQDPDQYPTQVLIELAKKMKERREMLYALKESKKKSQKSRLGMVRGNASFRNKADTANTSRLN
jgi:hypothetical protein